MKTRVIDAAFVLFIIVLIVMCSSCVTQKRCALKFPPVEKDSIVYRDGSRDTFELVRADSSMVQYLIECQETANGYQARIVQLLGQQQGTHLGTPVATINNNVLTATATAPEHKIFWQYKWRESTMVFRRTVIIPFMKWWQTAFMWAGIVTFALAILFLAYRISLIFRRP